MKDALERQTTTFSIKDEHGERSSISIEKWAADLLTINIEDIHAWVQDTYNRAVEYNEKKGLNYGRRQVGDLVRQHAYREANKYNDLFNSSPCLCVSV
ncbi:MAG: hypothetical protein ABFR65_02330 [Pseudomonadota bacterium]